MPGEPSSVWRANYVLPVRDGFRDLGAGRRWRVAFDLERHERRVFAPAPVVPFNVATEER